MAVTMKVAGVPAVREDGKPVTTRLLAAAGLTVMPVSLPPRVAVVVSVTVSDCVPAVFRVALKVCKPWSAAVKV